MVILFNIICHIFSEYKIKFKNKSFTIKKYFFFTTDIRKFIEKYLNNDKLSDEQKEYLLECLESGMSVKEMDSFASEHLSVDQMKRLSSLYRKRKG